MLRPLFTALFFMTMVQAYAQKRSLETAANHFESQQYAQSCEIYHALLKGGTDKASNLKKACLACLKGGKVSEAQKILQQYLDQGEKLSDDMLFYQGEVQLRLQDYEGAAASFKSFLKKSARGHEWREQAKKNLMHAAMGMKRNYIEQQAIVENAGSVVNTQFDERYPVPSPTLDTRYYFSSSDPNAIGGKRDQKGKKSKNGMYRLDIHRADLVNGQWQNRFNLGEVVNSSLHDYVLDFSIDGSTMYFFKGLHLHEGDLRQQVFSADPNRISSSHMVKGLTGGSSENTDVDFWREQFVIYSAEKANGQGGRDLYIRTKTPNGWSKAKNLGKTINSSFDEVDPFLAEDGRTLYFSSNNLQSFGGFDVFVSKFDINRQQWSKPVNLGMAVNSPSDDRHFKVLKDGQTGLFSSNRDGGFGGYDIYMAYFKDIRQEQFVRENPEYLNMWVLGKNRIAKTTQPTERINEPSLSDSPKKSTSYHIDIIYYRDENFIGQQSKQEQIESILLPLKAHPRLTLILEGHRANESTEPHNKFYSIRVAQSVKDYLVSKGIDPSRIMVRGFGTRYPYVVPSRTRPSPLEVKFNNRIEARYEKPEELNVHFKVEEPNISPELRANKSRQPLKGLSYMVVIAKTDHLFLNTPLIEGDDALIACFDGQEYWYLLEGYRNYFSAKLQKSQLKRGGFDQAAIIPYFNEYPITGKQIVDLSVQYPDLVNYLNDQK